MFSIIIHKKSLKKALKIVKSEYKKLGHNDTIVNAYDDDGYDLDNKHYCLTVTPHDDDGYIAIGIDDDPIYRSNAIGTLYFRNIGICEDILTLVKYKCNNGFKYVCPTRKYTNEEIEYREAILDKKRKEIESYILNKVKEQNVNSKTNKGSYYLSIAAIPNKYKFRTCITTSSTKSENKVKTLEEILSILKEVNNKYSEYITKH